MPLSTSPQQVKLIELHDCYLQMIRTRAGNRYLQIPASQKLHLEKILGVVEELSASVEDFVACQFVSMPVNFCKRTFHSCYPPLSTFFSPNAKMRYRLYEMDLEVSNAREFEGSLSICLRHRAKAEEWHKRNSGCDIRRIQLALTSGELSLHSLAWLGKQKLIDADLDATFRFAGNEEQWERAKRMIGDYLGNA